MIYVGDVDVSNVVSRRRLVGAEELFPNFRQAHSIPSFLPSFLRHSKFRKFLIAATVGAPLSTLILISRIPPSVDAAGRFFRAIEDVRIVRREQTRACGGGCAPLALKRAHWLLRWSQRLDMCTRRLQKLAETYANTRSLPRRHETEAYSRGPGCLFYT